MDHSELMFIMQHLSFRKDIKGGINGFIARGLMELAMKI